MTKSADDEEFTKWTRWLTVHDDGEIVLEKVCPNISDGGITYEIVINVPTLWTTISSTKITLNPSSPRPVVTTALVSS